jgi:hypothetical protein
MVTTRTQHASATRFALAGCLAAAGYGTLKAVWALDGTIGLRDPSVLRETARSVTATQHVIAYWGTVALAALAAGILLALVRPWGRRVPRRPLRVLAALGALLAVPGAAGFVLSVANIAGLHHVGEDRLGGLYPGTFVFVYGCFFLLGVAFAATVWLTRGSGPPPAAARIDPLTWVTWIAILAPLPYTLSRLAWSVGVPVGISTEGLRELGIPGWGSLAVLGLALLTEATAVFVHAFVLRRARAVPGWVPLAGGRPVTPGTVVAVLLAPVAILAYSNVMSVAALAGVLDLAETGAHGDGWGVWGTGVVFAVWGAALTAATVGYHRATRRPPVRLAAVGERGGRT